MVRGGNLDYTALDQVTEIVQNRVMNSRTERKAVGPSSRSARKRLVMTDADYVVVGAGSSRLRGGLSLG